MPTTPLTSHWYYMLLSLAAGPRHGLAVARDVQEFSGGRMRLWPATLYGALEDLLARDWIEEIEDAARRPDASERKRYYGITRAGRAALDAETERLATLVKRARAAARKQHA